MLRLDKQPPESSLDRGIRLTYESVVGYRAVKAAREMEATNPLHKLAALVVELELMTPQVEAGIRRGHMLSSRLDEMRAVPERFARDHELTKADVNRAHWLAERAIDDLQLLPEGRFRDNPNDTIAIDEMLQKLEDEPRHEVVMQPQTQPVVGAAA